LSAVIPSVESAAEYLRLDDEDHPAYIFLCDQLAVLSRSSQLAAGGYMIKDVESMDIQGGCIEIGKTKIKTGQQVAGYLKGSTQVAMFLCTASELFSKQAKEYNAHGDILEAYVIDAIGSLTVENAMDRIQRQLETALGEERLLSTNRYSPGYCNWALSGQKVLFALIGDNPTGIRLTSSCLMRPIKSVSGIIGIGTEVKKREYGCVICKNQECIYRKILHR
jgi:hypothetical protein